MNRVIIIIQTDITEGNNVRDDSMPEKESPG
jgi:hypothetical protein